jgi:methylated-DNA-[protein]-cysteine S-methyltransferase
MTAPHEPTQTPRDEHLALKAAEPDVDPCDIALEAMPGYVIGDMAAADQAWIDSHAEQCNYCRNELQWFERIDELLDHLDDASAGSDIPTAPRLRVHRKVARYGSMPSPLGDLLIAVSDDGICEISFGRSGTDKFLALLDRRGFEAVADQQAIESASAQLREYFSGRRHVFDLQVDLTGVTPFTKAVLTATSEVPFGRLLTYRDIARSIGKPNATRAVGNALGRNPVPVVVPCHRVVRSDNSLGGYTGGLDIKERLLSIEGATLPVG